MVPHRTAAEKGSGPVRERKSRETQNETLAEVSNSDGRDSRSPREDLLHVCAMHGRNGRLTGNSVRWNAVGGRNVLVMVILVLTDLVCVFVFFSCEYVYRIGALWAG